jgi:catechol 2,3-dioxygenase-like lactoylglutathione lyase family enzyme
VKSLLHGVWHFSFTVADLDISIPFYRDIVGFSLVHVQDQENAYTSALVGYPDAHIWVAQFAVPGQLRGLSTHDLELVEYMRPKGKPNRAEIRDPGQAHLAITVDDIQSRFDAMRNAGVEFVSPPVAITHGVNQGGEACYFHDPDDAVLEMLQPPAERLLWWTEVEQALPLSAR